jgi:hypothetical protein
MLLNSLTWRLRLVSHLRCSCCLGRQYLWLFEVGDPPPARSVVVRESQDDTGKSACVKSLVSDALDEHFVLPSGTKQLFERPLLL